MAFKPSGLRLPLSSDWVSARAISVCAMRYRLHHDRLSFVEDPVEDPVVATVGGVKPFQFKAQRSAYPSGLLGEGTVDELDRGCGNLFRQPLE